MIYVVFIVFAVIVIFIINISDSPQTHLIFLVY